MKVLQALFLAMCVGAVAGTHRHQTSAPRNFYYYLQEKMRNVCDEITDMKAKIQECCNPAASCMQDGQSHQHGSIFLAVDGCNFCVCSYGSVTCTNSTGCGQDINESSYYHYKDTMAQGYCSYKAGPNKHQLMGAIRRDCNPAEGVAPSCDDICSEDRFATVMADLYDPVMPGYINICLGALWVMMDHPVLAPNPGPGQTDAGLLNLVTISYDKCVATGCGPNYCCCAALIVG